MISNKRSFSLAGAGLAAVFFLTSPLAQAEVVSLGEATKSVGSFLSALTQPPVPKPDPQLRYVRDALGKLKPENWIAFSPANPKAHVYVFADATCPYSRELHQKVPEFNAKGIEVRYVAWPTGQLDEPAWTIYKNIWCSDNPKQALDDAMKGKRVKVQTCSKNDISTLAAQQDAGKAVGVTATPTTYYQDGHWAQGVKRTEGLPERAILGAEIVSNRR
ncbi:hypothetical protein PS691_01882 [Pseudomonas fluorescens]|uniref:Thiol:disulfide interchange protein n=2 Tax=Pseudomonas fluorescens TaxID=294 RepID=A0A5E7C4S5_PSEFL|nr:hypothetical protein PS691_01882 [Pseudomonas fluorescens]